MDEILKILLQVGLILVFFSISIFRLKSNKILILKNITLFDQITFNLIILINLILFLSFFNFKIFTIILIISFVIFLSLVYNLVSKYSLKDFEFNLKIFFFIIFFILISFDLAFNLRLGWDAQKLWFPKVLNFLLVIPDKIFFIARGTNDIKANRPKKLSPKKGIEIPHIYLIPGI